MPLSVTSTTRLLFIGDSITDCDRREDPEGLGQGYVRLCRDYFAAKDPSHVPHVINKGISGNKITDLRDRWAADVIATQPDILSVMIGINDVWHGFYDPPAGVSIEQYVGVYHAILRQVHNALPACRIVLCEPTVIWPPAPAEGNKLLMPYVRATNEVGREFGASAIVPTHGAFVRAREKNPDLAWAPDGVHPSSAGHMLLARTWLVATGLF
jgi:acyl-CoA thioesterase I